MGMLDGILGSVLGQLTGGGGQQSAQKSPLESLSAPRRWPARRDSEEPPAP